MGRDPINTKVVWNKLPDDLSPFLLLLQLQRKQSNHPLSPTPNEINCIAKSIVFKLNSSATWFFRLNYPLPWARQQRSSERGNQGNGYHLSTLPPAKPVCRPWIRAILQLLQVLRTWCRPVWGQYPIGLFWDINFMLLNRILRNR